MLPMLNRMLFTFKSQSIRVELHWHQAKLQRVKMIEIERSGHELSHKKTSAVRRLITTFKRSSPIRAGIIDQPMLTQPADADFSLFLFLFAIFRCFCLNVFILVYGAVRCSTTVSVFIVCVCVYVMRARLFLPRSVSFTPIFVLYFVCAAVICAIGA